MRCSKGFPRGAREHSPVPPRQGCSAPFPTSWGQNALLAYPLASQRLELERGTGIRSPAFSASIFRQKKLQECWAHDSFGSKGSFRLRRVEISAKAFKLLEQPIAICIGSDCFLHL